MIAKYYTQKKQISTNGSIIWSDVTPLETRTSPIAYANDIECGGEIDYSSVGMVFITTTDGIGWVGKSGSSIPYVGVFEYCDVAKDVVLNEGITKIEQFSFLWYSHLTNITLPKSLRIIESDNFYNCAQLKEIEIPENVEYIGENVFNGYTTLERIIMKPLYPPTMLSTTINQSTKIYVDDNSLDLYKSASGWSRYENQIYPFGDLNSFGCSFEKFRKQESYNNIEWINLDEYEKGEEVESGSSACTLETSYRWVDTSAYTCGDFAECYPYKAVIDYKRVGRSSLDCSPFETICPNGDSVLRVSDLEPYLGSYSYGYTYGNGQLFWINYDSKLTILEVGDAVSEISLSGIDMSYLTALTISSSVTRINDSSFYNAQNLTSLTIPSSVEYIGKSAFERTYSLDFITISNGVIDDNAFSYTGAKTIYLLNGVTSVGNYVFGAPRYGAFGGGDVEGAYFDDSVMSIGDGCFNHCYSLKQVKLPSGLTTLGDEFFEDCISLTQIEIPSGVTTFGVSVFRGCHSLSSIEIPQGITSLNSYTFCDCKALTSITIPSGVTRLWDYEFSGCTNLQSITFTSTTPPTITTKTFSSCNATIYVPSASLNTYKTAAVWETIASRIQPIS